MLRKPSCKRMRQKEREFCAKKVAPLAQEEDDCTETHHKRSYFIFRKKTSRHQRSGKSLSRYERRGSIEAAKQKGVEKECHSAVEYSEHSSNADLE
ncbi:unnamed protein product [Gongylonema pulchrum]|uniref:Ovule protein n=1 Tax=Gongylonema pulchrum TaxID=637853 RepID=A0A183D429_9BILA|nr:unnamed protein product [Gongylonema pulchrum]